MKLIIFGANGSIGKHLIQQGLERGIRLTGFSRTPPQSTGTDDQVHWFRGDVNNAADVTTAIRDQDTVICVLGDGRRGEIRTAGTRQIISSMKTAGVKRLICQTTIGCGDSYGNLNFFWKRIMFGWLLKRAFKDHQMQEQEVMASGLAWTIIRPSAFTDGPLTGLYKSGFDASEMGLTLKISRADVAHCILEQLDGNRNLRQAIAISH